MPRPLEMVRLGPSASNKQPWRIVKHDRFWRFYLRRTPGYREDLIKRILDLCDLQRLDMGIAMCHFELTARELGLEGEWVVETDLDTNPDELTEYMVSWESVDKDTICSHCWRLRLHARADLFDERHKSAFRLFNGFYEGCPDLVVDLYAATLVIHNYADIPADGLPLVEAAQGFYLSQVALAADCDRQNAQRGEPG